MQLVIAINRLQDQLPSASHLRRISLGLHHTRRSPGIFLPPTPSPEALLLGGVCSATTLIVRQIAELRCARSRSLPVPLVRTSQTSNFHSVIRCRLACARYSCVISVRRKMLSCCWEDNDNFFSAGRNILAVDVLQLSCRRKLGAS